MFTITLSVASSLFIFSRHLNDTVQYKNFGLDTIFEDSLLWYIETCVRARFYTCSTNYSCVLCHFSTHSTRYFSSSSAKVQNCETHSLAVATRFSALAASPSFLSNNFLASTHVWAVSRLGNCKSVGSRSVVNCSDASRGRRVGRWSIDTTDIGGFSGELGV